MEQDLTQLAVIIVCNASSGCDGVDVFFFLPQKQTQWLTLYLRSNLNNN